MESTNGVVESHTGILEHHDIDLHDHQTAYVFTPSSASEIEEATRRPSKRRKLGGARISGSETHNESASSLFTPLLNGREEAQFVELRKHLFETKWVEIEDGIQSILTEANEGTLAEVTSFVKQPRGTERVPAGFIVTGTNIASQGLLFEQLSGKLVSEAIGPVVILRSGEASNLKMLLKKVIKDATNQSTAEDVEDSNDSEQDGRKLLNYDLEILHGFYKVTRFQKVVVSIQDSEAFDQELLAEFIILLSSWLDRIPFVLLFGIATSVEMFHERLSRNAVRCLSGVQFDVEQTTTILERVFRNFVAGSNVSLRIGPGLISSLMERQNDHVQSVHVFIAALKYAYMCHFFADPLSVLLGFCDGPGGSSGDVLQPELLEAVRHLPSFNKHCMRLIERGEFRHAKSLFDDAALQTEIILCLHTKRRAINRVLIAWQVLSAIDKNAHSTIELYLKASTGRLKNSDTVLKLLDGVRRASLDSLCEISLSIISASEEGSAELGLEAWTNEEPDFLNEVKAINKEAASLISSSDGGKAVRSVYTMHNRSVRTTVVNQKVQLSQNISTLSQQDKDFTALIDRSLEALTKFVDLERLQDYFLSEVWIYDSKHPSSEVFTPKPRSAIELALSSPYDYLGCQCCDPSREGASMSHPPTAILYKMFLEAGTLINVFDLWTAFLANLGPEHVVDEDDNERHALMLFYRALADLKSLGMIKQSRKKADHLTKLTWQGL